MRKQQIEDGSVVISRTLGLVLARSRWTPMALCVLKVDSNRHIVSQQVSHLNEAPQLDEGDNPSWYWSQEHGQTHVTPPHCCYWS